jgi:hypothetical protein
MPPSAVAPTSFTTHDGEPTDRFGRPIFAPAVGPTGSRSTALIATGITGGLVIAAIGSYIHAANLIGPVGPIAASTGETAEHQDEINSRLSSGERWLKASYVFAVSAAVSGAVTGYLWTRAQPQSRQLLIHPTFDGGAAVSYSSSF